jgi:polyhydroxyalkanoate synthase
MISTQWIRALTSQPDADMRDVSFDDYLLKWIALFKSPGVSGSKRMPSAIASVAPLAIHGYTARRQGQRMPVADGRLHGCFAPGDIEVFIDESVVFVPCQECRGYLDGKEMAMAFRLLRSNSLIWHYSIRLFYGETPPPFDVLFWNMTPLHAVPCMTGICISCICTIAHPGRRADRGWGNP